MFRVDNFRQSLELPNVTVLPEERKEAEAEYKKLYSAEPVLNNLTVHKKEESRFAGIIGELVFQRLYPKAGRVSLIDPGCPYDFRYIYEKVDVKCKVRTKAPKLEYEGSFFAYQLDELKRLDVLLYFMSTTKEFDRIWLCGYMPTVGFMNHPRLQVWQKGEIDQSNGKKYHAKTYGLAYEHMYPVNVNKIQKWL